jgi:putative nucleotidyltransferase with HDIG domain
MTEPTRAEAWRLLCEFTASPALRRHGLSVEASMRALARHAGADEVEVELWGLVGLIHDFDYERFPTPETHVWKGVEILRERGWPERVVRGVAAHAGYYLAVPPMEPLERAIVAADELSGFVGACALVRPSKSVRDLPVESVVKKMKDKTFARAVDRGEIRRGAELTGLALPELVGLVIAAQVPIADLLGVGGAPAGELPDLPVPPPPPAA